MNFLFVFRDILENGTREEGFSKETLSEFLLSMSVHLSNQKAADNETGNLPKFEVELFEVRQTPKEESQLVTLFKSRAHKYPKNSEDYKYTFDELENVLIRTVNKWDSEHAKPSAEIRVLRDGEYSSAFFNKLEEVFNKPSDLGKPVAAVESPQDKSLNPMNLFDNSSVNKSQKDEYEKSSKYDIETVVAEKWIYANDHHFLYRQNLQRGEQSAYSPLDSFLSILTIAEASSPLANAIWYFAGSGDHVDVLCSSITKLTLHEILEKYSDLTSLYDGVKHKQNLDIVSRGSVLAEEARGPMNLF
jgi:hypothetical protein